MTTHGDQSAQLLNLEQKIFWLQLIRSEGVGPATFQKILNHFGSAANAVENLSRPAGRGKSVTIIPRETVEAELKAIEEFGAHLIALGEPAYPKWLAQMSSAPPLLIAKGQIGQLQRPMISIVGARNCSLVGKKMTTKLVQDLAGADCCIVSGLARGIDAAAHLAALRTGTIAVLAGGLDRVYPAEHEELAEQIIETGCLVSEMPLGWTARAQDFPRRNRIVAGLAQATVVVEAARRSGSLITARLAAEHGREVFAVPGSPLDPRAAGPLRLLKSGAHIATNGEDILTVIRSLYSDEWPTQHDLPFEESDSHDKVERSTEDALSIVANALGTTPIELDELVRFTNLPVGQVYLALLQLDLEGRLVRHTSNLVALLDPIDLD